MIIQQIRLVQFPIVWGWKLEYLPYYTTYKNKVQGWDRVRGGGRFKKERTYVYIWLIHVVVWQKPTQHCKAIILQLKLNKLLKIKK